MRSILILATSITLLFSCSRSNEVNINLKYDDNLSLEYNEVIDAYQQLADAYPSARLMEVGTTDIGKPLHLFMISNDRDYDPVSIRKKGKCIVLINNGIHPGEPEGIDASIQFAWDILANKNDLKKYLDNTVIAIIPVYNIGGSLDQSRFYRMNQDGPVYKGRRRNAKNMDLNRDFAKQETKNGQSFARLFTQLNPDVFLDTHTTNGSDHQFTVTLIETMHSKMDKEMGQYYRNKMLPDLYKGMEENSEYGMVPYVSAVNYGNLRMGISGFNDHPYYSTGYASLFNCFAFMTENLVYKYFPDRVRSVYDFLTQLVRFTNENSVEIRELKDKADEAVKTQKEFHLDWRLNREYSEELLFKGYEYEVEESSEGGRRRGVYNHDKPWEEIIPYYTNFDPVLTVEKPYAYIIPQAWEEIIDKFENNAVTYSRLTEDVVIEVESSYIDKVESSARATQGHKLNRIEEVRTVTQELQYYKGDFVVLVNQQANRYIVQMLEPTAPNSFLVWNYFDPIFESSDFYSIWGFESHLFELVDEDKELRDDLEAKKAEDPDFAADRVKQLQYLYEKSEASQIERWQRLYPVARVVKEISLPIAN